MLRELGLSRDEEAVYTALLTRPVASVAELVRRTVLTESEVIRVLDDLALRGLVAVDAAAATAWDGPEGERSPAGYRLAPPSVALAPFLVEQRNALQRAETAFSMVTEQYRSAVAHPAGGVVEVVVGVEQVAHRFHQLQRGAQQELLTFLVGEPRAVRRADADVSESFALERGVAFRAVAAQDYLDGDGVLGDVHAGLAAGLELRLADTLPLKMLVSDRERAMVPLDMADSDGEPSAIVVHRSGLLGALVHLFEREWEKARPLRVAAGGVRVEDESPDDPTEGELAVLALLLAGVSDRRAAAQLGVSVRTVERRTRRLMDLAGADSRLQLGWHAARAGWL
ncbi:TrmB family transcriptional regulator [Streptomyces xanthii]|uniref:Helix-turn-helix domain-containing protein n=1 Tax=Streptomyces xanthii TaxID=2768069 RepID=A0A7H1BH12_9ACTN|nr:helix-turn-helix domain-containing protein [Streptomyces xanthii]QNS08017.1 helix-turn-helix domain-containing protein [Streptomyces xanthii]